MNNQYNPLPGVDSYQENMNPTLRSPNSPYILPFYQTRESLIDIDNYRNFLKNIESKFRKSATYTGYKAHLMNLGFNHCQVHGNINSEMAELEMHHAILTLFDIALMISEHFINTIGYVTTFDVVQALKEEHRHNNIALVMLSKTPHQLYHNDSSFFIHPSMCMGNWPLLIEKYKYGLTQDVAFKLLYYLKKAIEIGETTDNGLLDLREKIMNWSEKVV